MPGRCSQPANQPAPTAHSGHVPSPPSARDLPGLCSGEAARLASTPRIHGGVPGHVAARATEAFAPPSPSRRREGSPGACREGGHTHEGAPGPQGLRWSRGGVLTFLPKTCTLCRGPLAGMALRATEGGRERDRAREERKPRKDVQQPARAAAKGRTGLPGLPSQGRAGPRGPTSLPVSRHAGWAELQRAAWTAGCASRRAACSSAARKQTPPARWRRGWTVSDETKAQRASQKAGCGRKRRPTGRPARPPEDMQDTELGQTRTVGVAASNPIS